MHTEHTNRLIHESSPYLLQHAHNPVDWFPWGEEAFEKAKKENKLVLVSVGYSSCHWCHVMERESFEKTVVSEIMNAHFVCIKVDREERPDVDQIYMDAVQLMTGSGGWPLNCFTLPDGRPVYGGTYFRQEQWMQILESLAAGWKEDPEKFEEYAERLTEGVRQTEQLVGAAPEQTFEMNMLDETVSKWKTTFDNHLGGGNRAPKFPLPNNYEFLLHYANRTNNAEVASFVDLTLEQMATGGIYDQVGGGFARYSVDSDWKVPHFEKMLYDNAQLLSLYSKAYKQNKNPMYKRVVAQTIDWLQREMMAPEGAFYSALDADSEGEEGKFYVWTEAEIKALFPEDFDFVWDLYNDKNVGFWENGNHILMRRIADEKLMKKYQLSDDELQSKVGTVNQKLLAEREKRVRPGLDDKSLTSWNALTITGLCNAYAAFENPKYLELAIQNAEFILNTQRRDDGGLNHSYKAGKSTINGYLEDYCFTIEALIDLYEATFNEAWLTSADEFTQYALAHFGNETTGMFYFTSDEDPPLIARKTEISDNVVPASNSSMAKGLYKLGHILYRDEYTERSKAMLSHVTERMQEYGSGYSNWAELMLLHLGPFYEVVITGKDAMQMGSEIRRHYLPNSILLGAQNKSELPLFEDRFFDGKTTIFVCENRACQLPVHTAHDALKQLK